MKDRISRAVCALLIAVISLLIIFPAAAYADGGSDPTSVADGIILWKKGDVGSGDGGYLINDGFLSLAGSTPGDWYPIGLSRLGISDNQAGYLAVINENVAVRYGNAEKLDRAKSTEWHRIALAVLACGGNPRRMGDVGEIDLIADGVYNRKDERGNGILGRQGINGFIWGLIAVDSMCYEIPEGAYYTRDDIILNILSRQLSGGGWALSGEIPDPDITGMAIQSLAPYYNSEKEYSFVKDGFAVTKKVRDAVNDALGCLSSLQNPDGGFTSWGTENCESGVQVAVALCSLGIDPFSDGRFIKNGHTVYDGIMKYRNSDGGLLHSFVYDEENPSSLPDRSNSMASEQALYAMAAIYRYQSGLRRLYDMRAEMSAEVKTAIGAVESRISALTYSSSREEIAAVYADYLEIPGTERSYVRNYSSLSALLAFSGIEYSEEEPEYSSGDAGVIRPIEEFTEADRAATDSLPKVLTTEYRAKVLRLYSRIQNCFDFVGKETYAEKLRAAKETIDRLQREIDALNAEIKEKLYPFESISLSDKGTVDDIYARALALSEYDRTKIERFSDVVRAKTQVDNTLRAVIIGISLTALCAALTVSLVLGIRARRRRRAREMDELAALYENEDSDKAPGE